jgi:hypothetical protein
MSDTSYKIYIFSLKSVGRLVRWSPLLTLSPKSQIDQKKEQKIKVLPGDQKSESNFHGFNPKTTIETSDQNFARDFE